MRARLTLGAYLSGILLLAACGGDSVPRKDFACVYEERRTECGGTGFGPWEPGCSFVDFEIRDDLTPDTFCEQAYPASDTECGGSCCISFQFRNVSAEPSCP